MPCNSQKAFESSMKWVVGILIVIGGAGIGLSYGHADEAIDLAQKAMNKSDTVDVIMVKVENIQEDVNELKYMRADITALKEMVIRAEARDQIILSKFSDYEFKTVKESE